MYYNDTQRHHLPHFHARYGEYSASFAIDPLALIDGVIPQRQMRLILAWAELHQQELRDNWARATSERRTFRIDGLR